MKVIILLFCAVAAYAVPYGEFGRYGTYGQINAQSGSTTGVSDCYGLACPGGSTGCDRRMVSSEDRINIVTTLECQDEQGNVLISDSQTSRSPYPGVEVQSHSHRTMYSVRISRPNRPNQVPSVQQPSNYPSTNQNNYNFNNNLDDQIETFE